MGRRYAAANVGGNIIIKIQLSLTKQTERACDARRSDGQHAERDVQQRYSRTQNSNLRH